MQGRFAAMDKGSNQQDLEPSVGRRGSAKCLRQEDHVEEHGFPWTCCGRQKKDEGLSLSLMSVSTASCSQWKMCCGVSLS